MNLPNFIKRKLESRMVKIYTLQCEIDSMEMDLLVPPTGFSRIEGWRENLQHKLRSKKEQLRRLESERK